MSYHDRNLTAELDQYQSTYSIIQSGSHTTKTKPMIRIEVILHKHDEDAIWIQEDEDGPVRALPRHGVKIVSRHSDDLYATLEMSEKRAISLNLA